MFEIVITPSAREDLASVRKSDQTLILDAIERLMALEPLTETRNRKPLRSNDLSAWEVRVGVHRVFYDVDEESARVIVKAIGWKEHNKLFIRGKEHQL